MHRVGVSNLYFLGILIKLLNGWHQILFLPAMGFSLKENDQCKVALGLFSVGPSAAHLCFYAAHLCFYVALPMFFTSNSPRSHWHLVNYNSQLLYLCIYRELAAI